jgi:hypothetical protein
VTPRLHRDVAEFTFSFDRLWTQPEAAAYLQVSERYLRDSTCPKVLLPGKGETDRPLVRYEPAVVKEWYSSHVRERRFA